MNQEIDGISVLIIDGGINMSRTKRSYCWNSGFPGIILHLVERLIPVPVPVPGIKLGLANSISLITICFSDLRKLWQSLG